MLCRNVFHCKPAELRQIDPADILIALTCLRVEGDVRELYRQLGSRG